MQVGDLVKLLQDPEVLRNNQDINPDSVGFVVEVDLDIVIPTPVYPAVGDESGLAWVKWNGHADWDSMFIEDLEIISASR